MKRRRITEELCYVDIIGPVDKTIADLVELKTEYCKKYTKLRLVYSNDWIHVFGDRLETNKELALRKKRILAAKKANKKSQESKRAANSKEYLRLKKMFADTLQQVIDKTVPIGSDYGDDGVCKIAKDALESISKE